jgi:bifunctional non-homologous end joining protein LigD
MPADLLTQKPMLATPCATPAQTCVDLDAKGEYLFDVKWDGVRCLAYVDNDQVTLRNRRGATITDRYPEVVTSLLRRFAGRTVVLDAELVAFDPTSGKPDFSRIARRDQLANLAKIKVAAKALPATLMVFDVLYADGRDMRRRPLRERIGELPGLVDASDAVVAVSVSSLVGSTLWQFVTEQQMEGLIAKRLASGYTGRRDQAWVKLKANKRLTAIVTGYVPGEGARSKQVGALIVSLLDEAGDLVPVGKVGTGFKEADHGPLLSVLRTGQEFLVDVEFLEMTHGHQLRFPSYKGVRSDVARSSCTLDQNGH